MLENFIREYEKKGVRFWVENGQLKFRAPAGVLSIEDKEQLKEKKEALLSYYKEIEESAIIADPLNQYEPFLLTGIQSAYLLGRNNNFEYGGVGCHAYFELTMPVMDEKRLETAWHSVIKRHNMLRAVVLPDGTQKVLEKVQLPSLVFCDIRGKDQISVLAKLEEIRGELSNKQYVTDKWPLYDLYLTTTDHESILHFSIDMLISDFVSTSTILRDLDSFYYEKGANLEPLEVTFRDILLNQERIQKRANFVDKWNRDKNYWLEKVEDMPEAPELPTMTEKSNKTVTFRQWRHLIDRKNWERLCNQVKNQKITPSGALLAAYAEVIGRWSKQPSFCIDITILNRPNIHDQINQIVGDFTEVDILEVSPAYPSTFSERAKKIQNRLWEDLGHNTFTGMEVLREINRKNNKKAIYPVVFTSTVGAYDSKDISGEFMRDSKLTFKISQTPQVWIDCQVSEQSDGVLINWDVRDNVFPDGMIEDAFKTFKYLIEKMALGNEVWESVHPLTLPKHVLEMREKVNSTTAELPVGLLQDGFIKHVRQTPDNIALICREGRFTYGDLGQHVAIIQKYLIESGCNAGNYVVIALEKGIWQVASVLATLITGAVYLPVDVSQPLSRLNKIVNSSSADFVITDDSHRNEEWAAGPKIIVAEDMQSGTNEDYQLQDIRISSDKPAYVIHTSGTTGTPKGVVISHKAALNTIQDINNKFDVTDKDKVLGLANLAFDLSVYDLFGTFLAGACLVLPDPARRKDPYYWCELVTEEQITVWNSVPAQMQMLVTCLKSRGTSEDVALRLIMLSGDWIPVTLPGDIKDICPSAEVISLGGATEAAIWSIYHRIQNVPESAVSIPYGKPLANQQFYILDGQLQQCPDWVAGAIYIAGDGLALEYLNNEEETKARFIYHPVMKIRLYHTGDVGKYWPDGTIEFLGREDTQVKIHGHRIELSEIESVIQNHKSVEMAVVLVTGDLPADYRIVAFVQGTITEEAVKTYIKEQLPEYMIPSWIEILEEIPLSVNGKVNRKQLQQQAAILHNSSHERGMPPKDGLEKAIAEIWKDLLHVSSVSRDDDFYDIGGDSLLVAQAVGKIKEQIAEAHTWEWDRLMIAMLQSPTVSGLAEQLVGESDESSAKSDGNETPLKILAELPDANSTLKVFFPGGIGTLKQFGTLFQKLINDETRTFGIAAFDYSADAQYLDSDAKEHIVTIGQRYAKILTDSGYRRIQPIGYCMGGLVAIEAARTLIEYGIEVELVTTIDTIPIVLEMEGDLLMERSYGLMVGADVVAAGHVKEDSMLTTALELLKEKENGLISEEMIFSLDGDLKALAECYSKQKMITQEERLRKLKEAVPPNSGQLQKNEYDKFEELFALYRRNYRCAIGYTPEPFAGDIRALSCMDEHSPFVPVMKPGTEEFMNECALGELEVIPIEGNHLTCIQSPLAEKLAEII